MNFNCTIQELKPFFSREIEIFGISFQLHHTGIKTQILDSEEVDDDLFQLHHTGIKTAQGNERNPPYPISIAPYRN